MGLWTLGSLWLLSIANDYIIYMSVVLSRPLLLRLPGMVSKIGILSNRTLLSPPFNCLRWVEYSFSLTEPTDWQINGPPDPGPDQCSCRRPLVRNTSILLLVE